ncbi:hypothetical protein CFIMG_008619RA00001 [Ceratocystis fimbriata CBS 114723]|uniref:DUF7603 domain-containing protein n=1 Tax=Ceratocystis fimbriata CBS 114723 TaxID=1035309 RepID=A0A2C5X0V2_9PEZI|nr:hypothetical protein CFIMG_008619RA00001 [Ceratocystis fimbriata CBS 114723]
MSESFDLDLSKATASAFPHDSGLQEDEDLYLETRMLDLKHQTSSSPNQSKEEAYIEKAKQDNNKTSGVDSPTAIVQGPAESQSSNPLVSPAPGPNQASSFSSDVEQAQRHQDLDRRLLDDAFLFSPNPPSPQQTAPVAAPKLVQHPAAAQNTLSRSSSCSSFHVLTKGLDSYFENEIEDGTVPTQSRNLLKGKQDNQIVNDQQNGEARLSTATLQTAAVSSRLSGTLTTEPASVLPVHDFGNTRPPASPSTLQRISLSSLASPIAQLQSPIAGSPIKRKPLSASASALATRFSNPPVRKSLDKDSNLISPKLQPSVAFFQPQSLDQSLDSLDSFPLPPSVRTSKENICEEHSKKLTASQGALDSSRSSLQNPVDTADLNIHPDTALTTVPHSRNTSVSCSASKEQGVNETRLYQKEEEEEEEETSFGLPNIRPGYLEETQPQERYEPQGPYHHPFSPVTASQQFPYEIAPNTSSKSYHDFAYEEERESRLTLSYHQIDTIDEVTEPETSPKYRDSFQSSVYSLPTADYASLDGREPVSRKLGPAFEVKHSTYSTRPTPTPDTSQLSAYPESPPPLPPKPEDRRLSFNTPPIPPPKPGATSAQTATITSHADPGLSSPILPLHPTAELNKPLPRSPNQPNLDQGELFVWTPGADSPTNSAFSSIPSPVSPQRTFSTDDTAEAPADSGTYTTPKNIPAHVLAQQDAIKYLEDLQTPPATKGLTSTNTTGSSGHEISDMEDELKAISAELAASIRREMDLEDIVDRLQSEVTNSAQSSNKRTSDYFSDSGYSSTKFSEYDQSREEIERIQRKADQEKARIRLELTTKVQEEREKRHNLDLKIQELSAKAIRHNESTQISAADNSRLKELENQCEDLRRRLSDEREMKDNFEHLLTALKGELEVTSNERDNLRDEVVPELRARVEGLEVQNAEMSTMSYESSKIQQELKALRDENDNLRNSKFESEMKTRVTSLTRSSSVASSFKLQKAPMGLSRSNTVKGSEKATSMESKDALLERLKDVEAQRDALHRALKSLLERQEFQNRESEKKIKSLETLQSRLLEGSPRKAGYEKEIENLKLEITVLRRRAEEAVEQKWRVESGLRGLKTDLDRAEAEISSLKTLLQANDILIPPAFNMASSASMTTPESTSVVSSESLNKALTDVQEAYQESLIRIRSLEAASTDEKTVAAIQRLETALANMTADRNVARVEADSLRVQAMNASASQAEHIKSEQVLSEQLQSSAQRIETLAAQVSEQLSLNSDLRQRLLDTVSRGEADRQANVSWVNQLQEKLRVMEEQLNAAQTATDERIAIYEEEIASLRMAQSSQLQRIGSPISGGGLRSPGMRSPGLRSPFLTGAPDRAASPLTSPMFPRSPRSPRMVNSKSFEDEAERTRLRNRVQELEKALSEAETEMQNIVGKISEAQIQVLTLQEERDAALRETRKVQRALEEEMAQAKRLAA